MTTRPTAYVAGTKTLILASGGLDSTTLAYLAEREKLQLSLLVVDYGQPAAAQEIATVLRLASALNNCAMQLIRVDGFSLGLMGRGAGAAGARVMAGRNALLLSIAANVASRMDCEEIWLGCNKDDAVDYPDCRETFVQHMAQALIAYDLTVRAPLLHCSRAAVVELARSLRVDKSNVWSCYTPIGGKPCTTCNSCLQEAL